MVVGDRSTKTGSKFWNKIKEQAAGIVAADYWRPYNEIIPEDMLIQTKAETYTVESYNGLIRRFLARFRRRTKCYSKSQLMMELSLKLLMAKRNNLISMEVY